MSERDLESLFLDFRERGDVAGLAQVFDRTSDELLTIALHLVPEPAQADDVVQATFLTAIQRAETFDKSRALMPWLVGILANQAARARQARAQSIDPGKLETRVQPEPSEELERAEVTRILERAVDDLPEPYRAAVKRHVLDGERAVDIARQSGVAAGTVRMHILRGLERLRRALPASLFAVGPWSVPGPESMRATVLEAARAKARILAASATTSATTTLSASVWSIGGLLMSIKILLGAGALVATALFVWNLAPAHETPATSLAETRAEPEALSGPGLADPARRTDSIREVAAQEQPPVALASASTNGWWLSGDVTGVDDNPPESTLVTVRRIPGDAVTANCDRNGHFALDVGLLFTGTPPSELLVSADHPANRHGNAIVPVSTDDADRGISTRVSLTTHVALEPFALLTGRVEAHTHVRHGSIDVEAHLVDTVKSSGAKQDVDDRISAFAPDDQGRFKFRVEKSGPVIMRAACDGLLPASLHAVATVGETKDIGVIVLTEGEFALQGDVRLPFDHAGVPLQILARRSDAEGTPTPGNYRPTEQFDGQSQFADVDEHDHFTLTGISAGTWRLQVRSPTSKCVVLWQPEVAFPVPGPAAIVGNNLARLVIRVQSAGKPCKGARLVIPHGDEMGNATSDDTGSATLIVDPSMDLVVETRIPGTNPVRAVLPAAERSVDMVHTIDVVQPVSTKGKLVLKPMGVAQLPERLGLRLDSPQAKFPVFVNVKLAEDRYVFEDVVAGRWHAVATPSSGAWFGMSGGEFLCEESFDFELAEGQELVVPIALREAGRVRLQIDGWKPVDGGGDTAIARITDAQGQELQATFVVRRYKNDQLNLNAQGKIVPLDVSSEVAQGFVPGAYAIVLTSDTWVSEPVSFVTTAGIETNVHILVRRL